MIIVLINWRILPSKESVFLNKWKTELRLKTSSGLIGEFLSRIEESSFHPCVTWEMEPDINDDEKEWLEKDYISYVNVGIWESIDGFLSAVAGYKSKGRSLKEDFEAAPRRRAVLTPEHWRRGACQLPAETSKGVDF